MSLGRLGGMGRGFGAFGSLGSAAGINLALYSFYDGFSGAAGVLNDTTAQKGGTWGVTGTGAANLLRDGAGKVALDDDTKVAYAYNNTALSATPKRVSSSFTFTSTVDVITCIALMTGNAFVGEKALHAATALSGDLTSFDITMLTQSTAVFLPPAWRVSSAGYELQADEAYTIDLHYEDKFAKATLKDHTGDVVLSQTAYDPDMTSYVGAYFFFEHVLTTSLTTDETFTQDTLSPEVTWPTLDILKETSFASDADGVISGTVFGGTASWSSGAVDISGSSYGAGGVLPIGTVAIGDKIYVSVDVTNWSGAANGAELALITPTGPALISNEVLFSADGRLQATLTATANATDAQVDFAASAFVSGSSTFTIDNLLVLKNPPTTP